MFINPEKQISPDFIVWTVPITILSEESNPLFNKIWGDFVVDSELIKKNLKESCFEVKSFQSVMEADKSWHERRIAFLMQEIEKGVNLGPISLELPILALNYFPSETISDGFHRIAAHLMLGRDSIEATYGGQTSFFYRLVESNLEECMKIEFKEVFLKNNPELTVDLESEIEFIIDYMGKNPLKV